MAFIYEQHIVITESEITKIKIWKDKLFWNSEKNLDFWPSSSVILKFSKSDLNTKSRSRTTRNKDWPGDGKFRPWRLSADDAAVECRRDRPLRHVRPLPTQLPRARRSDRDLLHPILRRFRDFRHRNEDAVIGRTLEVTLVADAAVVLADRGVLKENLMFIPNSFNANFIVILLFFHSYAVDIFIEGLHRRKS